MDRLLGALGLSATEGSDSLDPLSNRLAAFDKEWGQPALRDLLPGGPAGAAETVARHLAGARLSRNDRTRIVIEKPFGRDLASAPAPQPRPVGSFRRNPDLPDRPLSGQGNRPEHPRSSALPTSSSSRVWNRRYIDHVQITVAETVGVEHRGGYYDHAGALRDMIQNHLLQILCLIAMEPPVSFEDDEIRNKKVDVLHAIRPIPRTGSTCTPSAVNMAPGWLEGERVPAYREEPDVAPILRPRPSPPSSSSSTIGAGRTCRSICVPGNGSRPKSPKSSIQLPAVPHQSFPPRPGLVWEPNRLDDPNSAGRRHPPPFPGQAPRTFRPPLSRRDALLLRRELQGRPPEAYETLLLDVMQGDATLFMRADQVEAAWRVIAPVLENWGAVKPSDVFYPAGSWGPKAAETLMARDGRRWAQPSVLDHSREASRS